MTVIEQQYFIGCPFPATQVSENNSVNK